MATKPKASQRITYGKTGKGKATHDPAKVRNYRVDTSDIEPAPFTELNTNSRAFSHLRSSLWRRTHGSPVTIGPSDNQDPRFLRKLAPEAA